MGGINAEYMGPQLNGPTDNPSSRMRVALLVVLLGSALAAIDPKQPNCWHYIGQPDQPVFQNKWTNWMGGYSQVAYRIEGSLVQMKGLLKTTGTPGAPTMFTLPVAPPAYHSTAPAHYFAAAEHNKCRIHIYNVGQVNQYDCIDPKAFWLAIDGLKFWFDAETKWTKPTLKASWLNWGGGYGMVSYRKEGNIVYLRGLAKATSSSPDPLVFQLPAGYRPKTALATVPQHYMATVSHNKCRMGLYPNGDVRVYDCYVKDAAWVAFDDMHFFAEADDSAWINMDPAGAWRNWGSLSGGPYSPLSYRIESDIVYWRGLITADAAAPTWLGVLPVGVRPAQHLSYNPNLAHMDDKVDHNKCRLHIYTDGRVGVWDCYYAASTPNTWWLSFESISYHRGTDNCLPSPPPPPPPVPTPPDCWNYVNGDGQPEFYETWDSVGGGLTQASFRRHGDTVWLRGAISADRMPGGVATLALPEGFRPYEAYSFGPSNYYPTTAHNKCRLHVNTDGMIALYNCYDSGPGWWISLENIRFDVNVATSWTAFTPLAPYRAWAGGYSLPGYRKEGNIVYLKGLVTSSASGTAKPIIVLPVGFRPQGGYLSFNTGYYFAAVSHERCRLHIYTDGRVMMWDCFDAKGYWVSLDNIYFFADEATKFTALPMKAPYKNWGGGYYGASYRVEDSVVHMRGLITSTGKPTDSVVFTLPAEVVPKSTIAVTPAHYHASKSTNQCRMFIYPTGDVVIADCYDSSYWVAFEGISWMTDEDAGCAGAPPLPSARPYNTECWNILGEENQPYLLNSWGRDGSTPVGFRKEGNVVWLRGSVAPTIEPPNSNVFILPPGYRPQRDVAFQPAHYFPVTDHNKCRGVIHSDGAVQFYNCYDAGSGWWVSFDDLRFFTDDADWVKATPVSPFKNYGEGYNEFAYRKEGDIVYLSGVITSTADAVGKPLFTLPAGFRPSKITANTPGHLFTGEDHEKCRVHIQTDGQILLYNCWDDSSAPFWISFNNIQFFADDETKWSMATLTAPWANYGATYAPASYRQVGDMVFLRGLLKTTRLPTTEAEETVFTLPAGMRPAYTTAGNPGRYYEKSTHNKCRAHIYPTGDVKLVDCADDSGGAYEIFLDNLQFFVNGTANKTDCNNRQWLCSCRLEVTGTADADTCADINKMCTTARTSSPMASFLGTGDFADMEFGRGMWTYDGTQVESTDNVWRCSRWTPAS